MSKSQSKPKRRQSYHVFKRRTEENPDQPYERKCLVKQGTQRTTIGLTEEMIMQAYRQLGQADEQNCAGTVCVCKHRKKFNHPIGLLVDWHRNRVFIEEGTNKKGQGICRVYAHYDNIEELFDTKAGLQRLLARVRKEGTIEITLYPIKKGYHPRTGEPTHVSGPSGTKIGPREPRLIGGNLRLHNYLKGLNAPRYENAR